MSLESQCVIRKEDASSVFSDGRYFWQPDLSDNPLCVRDALVVLLSTSEADMWDVDGTLQRKLEYIGLVRVLITEGSSWEARLDESCWQTSTALDPFVTVEDPTGMLVGWKSVTLMSCISSSSFIASAANLFVDL